MKTIQYTRLWHENNYYPIVTNKLNLNNDKEGFLNQGKLVILIFEEIFKILTKSTWAKFKANSIAVCFRKIQP